MLFWGLSEGYRPKQVHRHPMTTVMAPILLAYTWTSVLVHSTNVAGYINYTMKPLSRLKMASKSELVRLLAEWYAGSKARNNVNEGMQ